MMKELSTIAEAAKIFAVKRISAFPATMVYHDIKTANRFEENLEMIFDHVEFSEDDKYLSRIGMWLSFSSQENIKIGFNKDGSLHSNGTEETLKISQAFFTDHPIDESHKKELEEAFKGLFFPNKPSNTIGMIIFDAITMDLASENGLKRVKKFYDELILKGTDLSKKKWYDAAANIVNNLDFYLPHCKEQLSPKLDQLALELQKEHKKLIKSSDLALKKELDISDKELKDLKKKLENSKGRDDRGIQTVFRTTSKNHYTLNELVDRKASIMITVNSIILSLVLGGLLGEFREHGHFHLTAQNLPILVLTLSSVGSIIFAILSIRPSITHGEFTEEDIRNRQGNLLYYGNFHNMALRDYEWAFLEMMSDQDYLYSSMVKDIYFLGQILKTKYKHIRIALTIFLFGISAAVLSFFAMGLFVGAH